MDKDRLREQVDIIREVFSYTHLFQGSVFVIKIDDAISDSPYFPVLVNDLSRLYSSGIDMVLVPGASQRINEILDSYGISYQAQKGIRITPPESIPFVKMAAFDVCNKMMTLLSGNNINAVIGNWVRARSKGVIDGIDYQYTGTVDRIKTEVINDMIKQRHIPIFPCIGWSSSGEPYNISSNELAKELAVSLHAKKIFFLQAEDFSRREDIAINNSIYRDDNGRLSRMTVEDAETIIRLNPDLSSIDTLVAASEACKKGVARAHILDGRIQGVILKEIFSNLGVGSMIFTNEYEMIRPMREEDISGVLSLMKPFIEAEILIPRTRRDLETQINDYLVFAVDNVIHGCAAFHFYPEENQAEIAGIAVDKQFADLGIGQKLLDYLLKKSEKMNLDSVFVLTTQTFDWFTRNGFNQAGISDIPHVKAEHYNKNRNSRILLKKIS